MFGMEERFLVKLEMTGRWARNEKGLETRDSRARPGMTVMGRNGRSPGEAGDDCEAGTADPRAEPGMTVMGRDGRSPVGAGDDGNKEPGMTAIRSRG